MFVPVNFRDSLIKPCTFLGDNKLSGDIFVAKVANANNSLQKKTIA